MDDADISVVIAVVSDVGVLVAVGVLNVVVDFVNVVVVMFRCLSYCGLVAAEKGIVIFGMIVGVVVVVGVVSGVFWRRERRRNRSRSS